MELTRDVWENGQMIIKDHTEHGKLKDGQLVTGADGKLWKAHKFKMNTAPGRPEAPEETWLERWSDEYSATITDAGCDEYNADDVAFPLTTVRVVPDFDGDEARILAMHAHFEALGQLDPRRYSCGRNDDGTMKLNDRWATRQERYDRWEAISRALYPGEIWPGGSR